MEHHFNTNIANKIGVNCAVILQNIIYWVDFNKANGTNFKEGFYWTYNSTKAFLKQFPYMTPRQIRYALDKLAAEGFILVNNFNNSCDRTLWYTYTEKALNLTNEVEESINSQSQNACESILPAPKMIEKKEEQTETVIVTNLQDSNSQVTKLSNGNDKIVTSKLQNCQNQVTKLSNVPDIIPQIKNSNIKLQEEKETYKEKEATHNVCVVVDFWNAQDLMPCSEITQDITKTINTQLKHFSLAEICEYIRRYAEVLHSKFYLSHQWSLHSFLTKRNAMPDFLDKGEKWQEYLRWKDSHNQDKLNVIYELYLEELKKEQENGINKG